MSKSIIFAVLLSSSTLLRVYGELLVANTFDNYSNLYPFLEKWATRSHTRMLTIIFDDYERSTTFDDHERPTTFDVSKTIVESLNVSVKIVNLKYLISQTNRNADRDSPIIEPGGCVILLFLDLNNLKHIFSSPHLTSLWQPENWYMLQERREQSSTFDYERYCNWAFERLWRFRRVHKLLLFTGDKVFRYDPFDYAGRRTGNYGNVTNDWRPVKSNEENFLLVSEPNATDISDFFDDDRMDFNGYPLKISIFKTVTMPYVDGKYSGLDFNYAEATCGKMNVTAVFVESKDKFGWEDHGAFFGTVGQLVYEYVDVSFNQFFIKDYLTRQIEFTTAITGDKLCVIVPKSPPVPDYLVIFKIFSGEAWVLIFVGHFVISMLYTILNSKRSQTVLDRFQRKKKPDSSSFDSSAMPRLLKNRTSSVAKAKPKTMGKEPYDDANGTLPSTTSKKCKIRKTEEKHPRSLKDVLLSCLVSIGRYLTKVILQILQPYESNYIWFPERLFLMCCLFLSLILNGVFTSQLASNLSKRMYYKDIDTLEELEESGLTILTTSRDILEDSLSHSTSPVVKRLHMRLQYTTEAEVQRRLFETKDAGYLHRWSTVSLTYDKYQREKLHVVKECPKEYILANIMTKGSPFRDRINKILGRLNNGGFYWKWYDKLFQLQKRAADELHDSTTHRKISIRHLFIPLAMLYVGLATSVIVFIFECRQNSVQ